VRAFAGHIQQQRSTYERNDRCARSQPVITNEGVNHDAELSRRSDR
jgi:hypothetical protein